MFVGEQSYEIFLDGQLIARDVPLQHSSGHVGLTTSQSSVGYSLVEVFPLFGGTPVAAVQPVALTPSPAASSTYTPTAVPTVRPTRARLWPHLWAPKEAPLPLAAEPPSPATSPVLSPAQEWRPISGRWRFADGELVQEDVAGFDQGIVYTGQAFGDYSV